MTDPITLRRFDVAARALIALLFLYSGFGKLTDPAALATRLADAGVPLAWLAAYVTIAVEIGAAVALILGYPVLVSCALLAGFTLLASLLFHQFWAVAPSERTAQIISFLKNLAVLGGLWFVARATLERGLAGRGESAAKPGR